MNVVEVVGFGRLFKMCSILGRLCFKLVVLMVLFMICLVICIVGSISGNCSKVIVLLFMGNEVNWKMMLMFLVILFVLIRISWLIS